MTKTKYNITPERVSEACSIVEYINLSYGDMSTILVVAPRFVVDENGEYIMTIKRDADEEIEDYEGFADALQAMSKATPKSLEKLAPQFREAAKNVVNPQRGRGSNRPSSMDTGQPLPGSNT